MKDLRKSTKSRTMDSYYQLRCGCGPCGCNCSCGNPALWDLYKQNLTSSSSSAVAGGYSTTMAG